MPLSTETSFQPVGPAYLYLGDFATPDVQQLGLVRNVQFNPQVSTAFTSADAQSGVPHHDGIYSLASQAVVTAEMQSLTYTEIKKLIFNVTETSSGTSSTFGAPDTFESVTAASVPGLFVLPSQENSDGVNAEHGIWLPAVTVQMSNLSFGRVNEGEIDQGYNVEFRAAYRDEDWASTAIPEGHRIWWIGKPSNLGLTWTLS